MKVWTRRQLRKQIAKMIARHNAKIAGPFTFETGTCRLSTIQEKAMLEGFFIVTHDRNEKGPTS